MNWYYNVRTNELAHAPEIPAGNDWQQVWRAPASEDGSRDMLVNSDPSLPPHAGQALAWLDSDGTVTPFS